MIKILDIMENALCNAPERNKQKTCHYPSEACKCMRAVWYSWKAVKKSQPKDATSELKKRTGTAIHDMCTDIIDQEISKRGEALFKREEWQQKKISANTKYPIALAAELDKEFSMRTDFTVQYPNKIVGGEIKTSWGQGFRDVWNSNLPKDEDLAQVCLYNLLTGIDEWHFIYIARDSLYRKEFILEFIDDKIKCWYFDMYKLIDNPINSYLERFKTIEHYVFTDQLPDREFNVVFLDGEIKEQYQRKNIVYKSDWHCTYCDWLDHCWKDADRSDTWLKEKN